MTQLFIVLLIMIIPVILVLAGMVYLFLLTKVVETNNNNNMNFPQGAWECSDFPIHEKRHKDENSECIEYPKDLCKTCCLPVDCQKENIKPMCEEGKEWNLY